jgi:hypothetical protein
MSVLINDILSNDDINYILTLPEVSSSEKRIQMQTTGVINFSIILPSSIKSKILDKLGLNLDSIPMRWIKGDTHPHIDVSSKLFNKTYLLYLTDSQGEFLIQNQSYPITKNSAFVFNEGLRHETINTGLEPRLLLGPMSEEGLAVGAATIISAPGGTTVYIKEDSGIQYSTDNQATWSGIAWPVSINNVDTSLGMLIIEFITDITIASDIFYFVFISENIQFGVKSLNNDGTRPKITIRDVVNYPGLIQNGTSSDPGNSNINVFNLEILSIEDSTIALGAGWLCQSNFSRSATDNYIINCYSDGEITGQFCGGIVGSGAASNGGNLTIIGCSSSGNISGEQSGGIVGYNSGINGGTVIIQSCWSTGVISATIDPNSGGCGGIVGSNSINTTVTNCYTTGAIAGNNAGGIVGANPANSSVSLLPVVIDNCYSFGNITGANSGGICGSLNSNNIIQITNCYSIGNVVSNIGSGILAGAICGLNLGGSVLISNCYAVGTVTESIGYIIADNTDITIDTSPVFVLNCYSEAGSPGGNGGGVWSNIHAQLALTGYPLTGLVGATWISGTNTPYLLFNMGYTPYSTTNISTNNLIQTSSASLSAGNSSSAGLKTGVYSIIQISGGNSGSYGSITINTSTGVISTTSSTISGTYTLYLNNSGSYNITTFTLTVTGTPPEPPSPTPNVEYQNIPEQSVSFNQKSSFCGTRPTSATAIGIGSVRGKGSTTRIFNYCETINLNGRNVQSCKFRTFTFK